MHVLEKILARKAGVSEVHTGEIVECAVDLAGINDLYPQTIYSFAEMGGRKVSQPDKVLIFMDHYAPPSTVRQAENQRQFREFARAQGIAGVMETHEGVCHQVVADKGLSVPGSLIVITDSHTTTHGAFGAFSTGVGATDMAVILATGKLWFRVPPIIQIRIEGPIPRGVFAKDIILHIIGDVGADFAIYKGVEFSGSAVRAMSLSERMALCNMSTEMGAKVTYIKPDEITKEYVRAHNIATAIYDETDPDFEYETVLTYDVSRLTPQLAAPASVDNVAPVDEYLGTPVDQAYIGSCTGGRTPDLAEAAAILRGKRIAPNTRLVVVPASKAVFLECLERGYIKDLVEAGATLVATGCAACLGTHAGIIAGGEVCISSTNRNFPGRMGHKEGRIFLASPATVAASALTGKITRADQL